MKIKNLAQLNFSRVLLAISAILLATTAIRAQQIEFVSENLSGTGSGDSYSWILQYGGRSVAQGRYVAFTSFASDLVPNGPIGNIANLYVRDLESGTTELASPDWSGFGGANANINTFEISRNGRYVAYWSNASNLVADDTNGVADVFIRDLIAGVTRRINVDVPYNYDYLFNNSVSISDEGTTVVFSTAGYNLGLPMDRNRSEDVYSYNTQADAVTLVSVDRYGTRAGNGRSYEAQVSGNGRFVLFASQATNLTVEQDANPYGDVLVRDLQAGTTKLVSITRSGTSSSNWSDFTTGHREQISQDGRYVTFRGSDDEFVANDHNHNSDIFQRDLVTNTTTLVSINAAGSESGNLGADDDFSVSPDGRFVAFLSRSSDLTSGDNNGRSDVFIRDLATGITRNASRDVVRSPYNSEGLIDVHVSPNGRFVGFNLYKQPSPIYAGYAYLLYLYNSTDDLVSLVPNLSHGGSSYLYPSGFSDDSSFFLFNGPATILPTDNNPGGDVYLMRLDQRTKQKQYVERGFGR
jgi:hypothetical protein